MDPFSGDPHIIWALYCVGAALLITAVVHVQVIVELFDQRKVGSCRTNERLNTKRRSRW